MRRARAWAADHPKRTIAVGAALGVVCVATVVAWLTLAAWAAPHHPGALKAALAALDNGDLEYAEALVERVQGSGVIDTENVGVPLFVLGAVKSRKAALEWSPQRRRATYLIAANYLEEARLAGFPEGREYEGLYLLGKALIESDQLREGARVLEQTLEIDQKNAGNIRRLMAEANYFAPQPQYGRAVEHLRQALESGQLEEPERSAALARLAQALSELGRHDEALEALAQAQMNDQPARRRLIEGQIHAKRAAQLAERPGDDTAELGEAIHAARTALNAVIELDKLATRTAGAAKVLLAELLLLEDRDPEALPLLVQVRRTYDREPEAIAAAMAEGDMLRSADGDDEALEAYRIALEAVEDPSSYRSELAPLGELRSRVLAAHTAFLDKENFAAASELAERLHPLFSRNRQAEVKADTHRAWGDHLIRRAAADREHFARLRAEGREKLRAAGVDYERLAEARFATRRYPTHLWDAAQAYFEGQSYTSTIRVLRDYLRYEPVRRNAQALLLLGQSRMALGKSREAVDALRECIEFHPADAATYRARLECAKAYRDVGDAERAERLLQENLTGGTLRPESPEWRDSLFALGRLLYQEQRYREAIIRLEDAVARYPNDPQTMLAKYLVAESHRHAAEAPKQRYADAKTVNERERNLDLVKEHLNQALASYEVVRRDITLHGKNSRVDRAMLRNCYMFKGAVLFERGAFHQDEARRARDDNRPQAAEALFEKAEQDLLEAIQMYSFVSNLFQNDPFMLEALVQISHCWRRLGDGVKARGPITQALQLLERLPPDADFATTTNLNRNEWEVLLTEMRTW